MCEGARGRAAGVFALALALRGPRALLRWDEVSLAYAAYAEPAARALDAQDLSALAGAWVGLHPPLHAVLWAVGERLAPVPALALGLSAAASAGASALLAARFGWTAGLVLALAPASISYAAEANNYPLAALLIAGALAGAAAPSWAVTAAAAGWGHVLGLSVGGALVARRLLRDGPRAARGALIAALGVAPVLVGAAARAGLDGTFAQPALDVGAWARGAAAAIGLGGLGQLALLPAARGRGAPYPEALWGLAALAAALLTFLVAGVAAPHQHPYLSLLAVPAAAAWGGVRGRSWQVAAIVLGIGGAGPLLVADLGRLAAVRVDLSRPRAVDLALEEARCGDLVWLVAPALQADDDKTDHAPVLWRLRPWRAAPRALHVPHDLADWRFGHPRWIQGLEVRTSTELAWGPLDAVLSAAQGRGASAWVVLYDHAPAAGLAERVGRALRPWASGPPEVIGDDLGLGADLLFRVPAPQGRGRTPPAPAGCAGA